MERQFLVAMFRLMLKNQFEKWGREIGPHTEGIDMKIAKPLLLDCLEEAFNALAKESREKWASQK